MHLLDSRGRRTFLLTAALSLSIGQVIVYDSTTLEQVLGEDVLVHYRFAPRQQVGGKRLVCASLEDAQSNEILLKDNCFAVTDVPEPDTLVLRLTNLAAGRARLLLSEENRGETTTVLLEVQPKQEIKPTYHWQTLHVWHTIPAGVETVLPIDGLGVKRCRIPQPWRLQLPMPHPCKNFLRMDLLRDTSISAILGAASSQCRMPIHCFSLAPISAQEAGLLDSGATVEESDLFNAPHATLRVLANCA
jgi:hypothetical protein